MTRPRVYIAGPYSCNTTLGTLDNIRRGQRMATEVLLAGYAPFCPWTDFHYQLMLRENESLTVEDYYTYSLAWLECSEAVLLLEGWEHSRGTLQEVHRAEELGIPIYRTLAGLKAALPLEDK